jgi:hypothetical protein
MAQCASLIVPYALKEIRESDDPRIRDYNRMVRILRRMFRFRGGRE